MKKIFLTGVILILLIVLAADFYTERNRANEKNKLQVSSTNATNPAPAGVAITDPADETAAAGISKAPTDVAYTGYRRHTRHTQSGKTTRTNRDETTTVASTAPAAEQGWVVVVDGQPNKDITVQKTNTYYGNKPVANEDVKKKDRHMPSNIGVELGYNQNTFGHNSTSDITTGNVNVGLLYNINVDRHFAIQPEVKYITKGNRLQSTLDDATSEKLSLHYLQVPVNFVYKFGKPGDVRFMIGAYPYAAYLLASKDKFKTPGFSDGLDVLPSTPTYTTNDVNTFDWGLGGFLGIQSPEGLFAKAGAEFGMMNVMNNTNQNRNNSIMLSVGYIIGGK